MSMSEADTRANLIDPVLRDKGWVFPYVKREESGKAVEIIHGQPRRSSMVYIDYTLRVDVNTQAQPVAVALIEAKAEGLPPDHGLEQAKAYTKCKRFNVSFIYASNGHRFVEYDRYTGLTSKPRPMADFPSRADLRKRYEDTMGFSLDEPAARALVTPYAGGEGGRRYYQDAAIRAVLEKIVQCERAFEPKRALLSLATGAGKTFIAVNLLKRIADAGQLRRALFVCDRDELRGQALTHMQNAFGADAAEVYRKADGTNNAQNARVHIATYQLPDRVLAMCRDLFEYLLKTGGPEQKTVIFCVRDSHADAIATEMNNLYAEWCAVRGGWSSAPTPRRILRLQMHGSQQRQRFPARPARQHPNALHCHHG